LVLFDDFDDAPAARLYDDGMVVDDGVPVAGPYMVLPRHLVERHALRGQHSADAQLFAKTIGRSPLAHDVLAETGPIFYAQDGLDGSGCGTDRASEDGADRSRGPLTGGRTLLSSTPMAP
jgi:hypothetical protein